MKRNMTIFSGLSPWLPPHNGEREKRLAAPQIVAQASAVPSFFPFSILTAFPDSNDFGTCLAPAHFRAEIVGITKKEIPVNGEAS